MLPMCFSRPDCDRPAQVESARMIGSARNYIKYHDIGILMHAFNNTYTFHGKPNRARYPGHCLKRACANNLIKHHNQYNPFSSVIILCVSYI